MKRLNKRNYVFLALFSMMLFAFNQTNAQVTIDGNKCEWANIDSVEDVDVKSPNGSSDIEKFWTTRNGNNLVLAMERASSGNALFAIYMDVDCNASNNNTAKGGADIALIFDVKTGVIQDFNIYEWTGTGPTNHAASGKVFTGEMGNSICNDNTTDNEFIEVSLNLNDFFDVCDTGAVGSSSCGLITITAADVHAGGSFPSNLKDDFSFNLEPDINLPPSANLTLTDTVGCNSEAFTLNASLSLHGDEGTTANDSLTYQWDLDYNGTFSEDFTGETPIITINNNGMTNVALIVTDVFGCKDTAFASVNVYGRPEAIADASYVVPVIPYCASLSYISSGSIDNNAPNNLVHFWNFGDGNTSSATSGDHDYLDCSGNNIYFVATDPLANPKCASDTVFFTIALPVEMLTFTGELTSEGRVQLAWSTASEHNNKGFHVLSSTDGENWSEMGFVEGRGNSNHINSYLWNSDMIQHTGTMYFRLKQVDFNGESAYSQIVKVNFGRGEENNIVYPSTSSSDIKIDLTKYADVDKANVTIINASGATVMNQSLNSSELNKIDISKLPNGFYILNVVINSKSTIYKITKN